MNDFTQDPTCIALWRFESGALTVDTIGGNNFTEADPGAPDLVNFWEGSGSLAAAGHSTLYQVADADLDAGFPFKSGGNNTGTFCLYYKKVDDDLNELISKWSPYSFLIKEHRGNFSVYIGFDSGTQNEACPFQGETYTKLVVGHAYHLGIKIDGVNKQITIRSRDMSTGVITTYLYAFTNEISVVNGNFAIGPSLSGNLDELVVFNRLLSDAEIDQIVAGTFGVPVYPYTPGLPLLRASRQPEIKGGTALTAIGDQVGQAVYWELVSYDPITGQEGAALGALMFQKTITDGAMHCKNYYFSPTDPAQVGKIDRIKARIAHA